MRTVFADAFFYFALVSRLDAAHSRAVEFLTTFAGRIVTTGWVLTELADGMSRPVRRRERFADIYDGLRHDSRTLIVPFSDELMQEGVELFNRRRDKEWTLTDCISFAVMQQHGITDALTGDRHFEQAGFRTLLK